MWSWDGVNAYIPVYHLRGGECGNVGYDSIVPEAPGRDEMAPHAGSCFAAEGTAQAMLHLHQRCCITKPRVAKRTLGKRNATCHLPQRGCIIPLDPFDATPLA